MTSRSIIVAYHRLAGLYTLAASLIWSVNTIFLLDAGLTVSEVFIANATFSAGMVLFEIPTGVVADTVGRRASYLLSIAVLATTTILYLVAAQAEAGIVVFSAVSLFMGLGFTFYSGALEAWLVDALRSVGAVDQLDRVFARAQQTTGAAMLAGTIVGGLLGQVDLAAPFIGRSALLSLVFLISWRTMYDLGFEPRPFQWSNIGGELANQTSVGISHGWNQPGLRRLMIAGLLRSSFMAWGFYAAQPYLLELLDSSQVWVIGVVTALVALSTIAGNQLVDHLIRRCRRRSSIFLGASATAAVAAVVVGVADSFWVAAPAFLVVTGSLGVMTPVRQAYLHSVTESENRATVISFDAMVGSIGGVGGQLGLGRLAGSQGFGAGYVAGGFLSALALPVLWSVRRIGGVADVTSADPAPREGTCAAQGLPANAQAPSTPRDLVAAGAGD